MLKKILKLIKYRLKKLARPGDVRFLTNLFVSITRTRRLLYERGPFFVHRFALPVISIGNITFGGTGKTPLTLALSTLLEQWGLSVLIATRGYKGDHLKEKKHLLLSPGFQPHIPDYFQQKRLNSEKNLQPSVKKIFPGDEPLMMSSYLNRSHILVGPKRGKNLATYIPLLRPDIVFLEDGFQHLSVERDLDLVVFDVTVPLSTYRMPPWGKLREDLGALRHVSFVILNRVNDVSSHKIEALKNFLKRYLPQHVDWIYTDVCPVGIFDRKHRLIQKLDQSISDHKWLPFTGIGNPRSFLKTLKMAGIKYDEYRVFSDHYRFTQKDLKKLTDQSSRLNSRLLTTEKDIMRIVENPLSSKIYYLKVNLMFKEGEEILKRKLSSLLSLYYQSF